MNQIDKLKSIINIVELAEIFNARPYGKGNVVSTKENPLRLEKTSSLKLYRDTNSYYDFGSGSGGDIIEFVCQAEGVDVPSSIDILKKMFNIDTDENYIPEYKPYVPEEKEYFLSSKAVSKAFLTNPFFKEINHIEHNEILNSITPYYVFKEANDLDYDFYFNNMRYCISNKTAVVLLPDENKTCHTFKYRNKMIGDKLKKWVSVKGSKSHYAYVRINDNPILLVVEGTRDFVNAILCGYSVVALPSAGYEDINQELFIDKTVIFIDDNDGKNSMISLFNKSVCNKKWFDHKKWGYDGKDFSDYLYKFDSLEKFKNEFENFISQIESKTSENNWKEILGSITTPMNEEDIAKIEDQEFLYPELLIKNNLTVVVAPPNTAKSALSFGLIYDLIKDEKIDDAFFLDPDSNVSYVKQTIQNMDKNKFHYYNGIKSDRNTMVKLLETMAALPIGTGKRSLIVCDGLQFFVDGSASEDKNSKEFLNLLKKVRDRFGATIILLHHTKREKDENGDAQYLGSQILETAVDNMLLLQNKGTLEITVLKSRADKKGNIYSLDMDLKKRRINSITFKFNKNNLPIDDNESSEIDITADDISEYLKGKDWVNRTDIQTYFKVAKNQKKRKELGDILYENSNIKWQYQKIGKAVQYKSLEFNSAPVIVEFEADLPDCLL